MAAGDWSRTRETTSSTPRRKQRMWCKCGSELSDPAPSDKFPPAKSYLYSFLNLYYDGQPLKSPCSVTWVYEGHFSLKPGQCVNAELFLFTAKETLPFATAWVGLDGIKARKKKIPDRESNTVGCLSHMDAKRRLAWRQQWREDATVQEKRTDRSSAGYYHTE